MRGIWKYDHLLPRVEERFRLTLGEGNTPLIRSKRIGPAMGIANLYFKLETLNPSGSYKDRFAACSVSHLLQHQIKYCLATSSGNTGAALAAYCAAAGVKCLLTIVESAPFSKLQQMWIYGSETVLVKGFGRNSRITDEVMDGLNILAEKGGSVVQISAYKYNPLGMAGVQTIAYEIADSSLTRVDHVFSPSGGGGLNLALSKGFQKWKEFDNGFEIPKVHCVQPTGNNTISGPLRNGLVKAQQIPKSTTSISGLQVPNVIDGDEVITFCRATQSNGYLVSDESVYECHKQMATQEGIFCEPAGAVALAGLKKALDNGEIDEGENIICVVTGHGFKDIESVKKMAGEACKFYFDNVYETLEHIESQIKTI